MAQELCIPHGVVVSAFAVGTRVASRRAPRDCSTPVATLPWSPDVDQGLAELLVKRVGDQEHRRLGGDLQGGDRGQAGVEESQDLVRRGPRVLQDERREHPQVGIEHKEEGVSVARTMHIVRTVPWGSAKTRKWLARPGKTCGGIAGLPRCTAKSETALSAPSVRASAKRSSSSTSSAS